MIKLLQNSNNSPVAYFMKCKFIECKKKTIVEIPHLRYRIMPASPRLHCFT